MEYVFVKTVIVYVIHIFLFLKKRCDNILLKGINKDFYTKYL